MLDGFIGNSPRARETMKLIKGSSGCCAVNPSTDPEEIQQRRINPRYSLRDSQVYNNPRVRRMLDDLRRNKPVADEIWERHMYPSYGKWFDENMPIYKE